MFYGASAPGRCGRQTGRLPATATPGVHPENRLGCDSRPRIFCRSAGSGGGGRNGALPTRQPPAAGKTTFLKIWAQVLRKQHISVIEFNAWETDFSDDPFVALCAELTRGFGEKEDVEYVNEVKKAAVEVIKHIGSNAVEKLTGGLVVPTKLWADLNEQAAETASEERLDKYQKAQAVIREFKEKLENMARAHTDRTIEVDTGIHYPLVVMIDELDRCRPSYAVELV